MDQELEEIKKKKLELLKNQYMKGVNKMENNQPNTTIQITDADFDNSLNKYKTLVIDCWAPWCGPCRMVGPVIEQLAKDFQGKIVFGKLNVDENQMTSMKYNIMSIPTLLIFKDGKLVDKIIGALPKEHLEAKLNPYI